MANPPCTKAGDRLRAMGSGEAAGGVDLSRFLGKRANTNADTECIESFSLVKRDDAYLVRALGKNAPRDWGEAEARPFAESVDWGTATVFHAGYDFGYMQTIPAANYNKGIIIIAAYGSFRSSYSTREFSYHDMGTLPS